MELSCHSNVGLQLADRRIQVSIVGIGAKRTHKRTLADAECPNTTKLLVAFPLRLSPRANVDIVDIDYLLSVPSTGPSIHHDQSDLCLGFFFFVFHNPPRWRSAGGTATRS